MNDKIFKFYKWKLASSVNDPLKSTIHSASEWKNNLIDVIQENLSSKFSNESDLNIICDHWERMVGPMLLEHTEPVQIKGNKLIVNVENAVFSQELNLYSHTILSSLKSLGIRKLNKIQCEIGEVKPIKPGSKKDTKRQLSEDNELDDKRKKMLIDLEKMKNQ